MGSMSQSNQIELNLAVNFIAEGDQVIAYTPALDISTVGKDEKEAKERFSELVRMFINDLVENNTVDVVLSELGWKKTNEQWSPPTITQQSINVEVPVFA
jgi:predicted RNase H-like HicB family nuclease